MEISRCKKRKVANTKSASCNNAITAPSAKPTDQKRRAIYMSIAMSDNTTARTDLPRSASPTPGPTLSLCKIVTCTPGKVDSRAACIRSAMVPKSFTASSSFIRTRISFAPNSRNAAPSHPWLSKISFMASKLTGCENCKRTWAPPVKSTLYLKTSPVVLFL